MAFDGITVRAVKNELYKELVNARISKIAQTEKDELIITIKNKDTVKKLLLSVNASLPLVYFTPDNKKSPDVAPTFCMLLRKYIGSGRIVDVTQPGLERAINIEIEHYNEMGDLENKKLTIELMGKYSNIIFTQEKENKTIIIDSIKRVPNFISSVREVLPGREYFIPDSGKNEILNTTESDYMRLINEQLSNNQDQDYASIISSLFIGISRQSVDYLMKDNKPESFYKYIKLIKNESFSPCIIYNNDKQQQFMMFSDINKAKDENIVKYDSVSELLYDYFSTKNAESRIKQKAFDLRRIVQTTIEKDVKKYELQEKQLKDTQKMDKIKLYGELLTVYANQIKEHSKSYKALNYYDNTMVEIPLDDTLSAIDNSKKYFEKYNRLKRTANALNTIVIETKNSIDTLQEIAYSIDIAQDESDLKQIKQELIIKGYIKNKNQTNKGKKEKKNEIRSKLLKYEYNGYEIYVGKNNIQNEEITFKIASPKDIWFHSKGIPGSHVIVKAKDEELPDDIYEFAASLAAFYSKGDRNDKVEIDYTIKKNIKKPAGAALGFVIYSNNYSMMVKPNEHKEYIIKD